MQNAFVFFTIMGQFFSTNYDITLCSNIDVHCGGPDVVESITQTENRPEASSDQERENSSANEDISVRNADPVTSDELIEDTSQDSSKREDKSTQVDEDIAVHESGPVTSDGRIEEISNNFSYELNDKSTQVDEDIAVQEPCQVTSSGQTENRPEASSDQERENLSANEDISVRNADPVTSDELIEDTSQYSTIPTVGSTIPTTPRRLVSRRN